MYTTSLKYVEEIYQKLNFFLLEGQEVFFDSFSALKTNDMITIKKDENIVLKTDSHKLHRLSVEEIYKNFDIDKFINNASNLKHTT